MHLAAPSAETPHIVPGGDSAVMLVAGELHVGYPGSPLRGCNPKGQVAG